MLNRHLNFVLSTTVAFALTALAAGSASAAGGNPSGKVMKNENVGTIVQGISAKPKNPVVNGIVINPKPPVVGIMPPKDPPLVGILPPKPPINGIVLPPKKPPIVGILPPKPPIVGILPPIDVVVVPPIDVIVTPPAVEVIGPQRRFPWHAGSTMAVAQPAMSKVEAPCNCLTKEYLVDGSVLFKDLCTKEAAVLTVEEMKAKQQGANVQNQ